MNEFIIDFIYDQMPYTALVSPKRETGNSEYFVKLESQNQELHVNIAAKPCGEGKSEWCFKGDSNDAGDYDPGLLQEIGEAIENYQVNNPSGNNI